MSKSEIQSLKEQLAELQEAHDKLAAENLTLSQGEVGAVTAELAQANAKIAELEAALEAQKGANLELIGNLEAAKAAVSSTKPTILVGGKTYTGKGKWLDRESKTYVTLAQCQDDEKLLKRSLASGIVKLYTPEEGGAE